MRRVGCICGALIKLLLSRLLTECKLDDLLRRMSRRDETRREEKYFARKKDCFTDDKILFMVARAMEGGRERGEERERERILNRP